MTLTLVTIPCLKDNYAFLIHNPASNETAVVDVPEAGPILQALQDRGWRLDHILLTHHHDDHIAGVAELREKTGAKVVGATRDAHRLPALDQAVKDGDRLQICGEEMSVIDVSGHTIGHIAFLFAASKLAFTGDSLMAGGCGRLFEGAPDVMWQSLSKLAALPPETLVCSGHEYTLSNLRFAAHLEPANPELILRINQDTAAREDGRPTVPSTLATELATNPFLRAPLSALKAAIGQPDASDQENFALIRALKDRF